MVESRASLVWVGYDECINDYLHDVTISREVHPKIWPSATGTYDHESVYMVLLGIIITFPEIF